MTCRAGEVILVHIQWWYSLLLPKLIFFGHLGAVETNCEHNIDISIPFMLIWHVYQKTVSYLHIQQLQSNISFHLESCLFPPDESESNVHFFSSVFGLYQLLREISGSLAAKRSTMFTSWSLNVSACRLVLSRYCSVSFSLKIAACCG